MSVNAGRVLSPTRHCEDLTASQSDAVRDEATAALMTAVSGLQKPGLLRPPGSQ